MANLTSVVRTFAKYPGFVLMRSVARFDVVRNVVVRAQSAMREPIDKYVARLRERRSEFFHDADPVMLASTVARDGFALGLTLPTDAVDELRELPRTNCCWVDS